MSSEFRVRDFLRDATKEQHALLDSAAASMGLGTTAGYARFLTAQASVLIPVEVALERGGIERLLPDWFERRRADAIAADLAELHITAPQTHAPAFISDAAILGAAYVLEGSKLGARVVLKQVGHRSATRFLRHGEGMPFWHSFLSVLETNPTVRLNPERAADAARSVFSLFIQAMTTRELVAA